MNSTDDNCTSLLKKTNINSQINYQEYIEDNNKSEKIIPRYKELLQKISLRNEELISDNNELTTQTNQLLKLLKLKESQINELINKKQILSNYSLVKILIKYFIKKISFNEDNEEELTNRNRFLLIQLSFIKWKYLISSLKINIKNREIDDLKALNHQNSILLDNTIQEKNKEISKYNIIIENKEKEIVDFRNNLMNLLLSNVMRIFYLKIVKNVFTQMKDLYYKEFYKNIVEKKDETYREYLDKYNHAMNYQKNYIFKILVYKYKLGSNNLNKANNNHLLRCFLYKLIKINSTILNQDLALIREQNNSLLKENEKLKEISSKYTNEEFIKSLSYINIKQLWIKEVTITNEEEISILINSRKVHRDNYLKYNKIKNIASFSYLEIIESYKEEDIEITRNITESIYILDITIEKRVYSSLRLFFRLMKECYYSSEKIKQVKSLVRLKKFYSVIFLVKFLKEKCKRLFREIRHKSEDQLKQNLYKENILSLKSSYSRFKINDLSSSNFSYCINQIKDIKDKLKNKNMRIAIDNCDNIAITSAIVAKKFDLQKISINQTSCFSIQQNLKSNYNFNQTHQISQTELLSEKIDDILNSTNTINSTNSKLQQEYSVFLSNFQHLQYENNKNIKELRESKQNASSLEIIIENLKLEISDKDFSLKKMKNECLEVKNVIANFKESFNELTNRCKLIENNNSTLLKEKEKREREYSSLHKKYEEQVILSKEYQFKYDSLKEINSVSGKEILNYQNDLTANIKEKSILERKIDKLNNENASVNDKLKILEKKNNKLELNEENLKAQINQFKQQFEEEMKKVNTTQCRIASDKKEILLINKGLFSFITELRNIIKDGISQIKSYNNNNNNNYNNSISLVKCTDDDFSRNITNNNLLLSNNNTETSNNKINNDVDDMDYLSNSMNNTKMDFNIRNNNHINANNIVFPNYINSNFINNLFNSNMNITRESSINTFNNNLYNEINNNIINLNPEDNNNPNDFLYKDKIKALIVEITNLLDIFFKQANLQLKEKNNLSSKLNIYQQELSDYKNKLEKSRNTIDLLKKEKEEAIRISKESKIDLEKAFKEMKQYDEFIVSFEELIKKNNYEKEDPLRQKDEALLQVKEIRQKYINIIGGEIN